MHRAKANAAPDGTCSLVAPSQLRIVTFEADIAVRLAGGCALQSEPYASWYTGNDANPTDYILFDGTTNEKFFLDYTRNSPRTTMKVGLLGSHQHVPVGEPSHRQHPCRVVYREQTTVWGAVSPTSRR